MTNFINAIVKVNHPANHNTVLKSATAEFGETIPGSVIAVYLHPPLQVLNGGPSTNNLIRYNISGTLEDGAEVEIPNVRYIGTTPAGNAHFDTN